MHAPEAVVVACDLITPYGLGIDACWNGLLSGKTAINPLDRFDTDVFQTKKAATIAELKTGQSDSLVMQMLKPLLKKASAIIPKDALLILATTTGEIDILEKQVLNAKDNADESALGCLLSKVQCLSGIRSPGIIVSAACTSSSSAIAQASAMIRSKERDCVLVVACDIVSEFVFAGFSSLMALDKDTARPFDKNRSGLSLGEAAGFVLVMSKERAIQEERSIIGEIAGWGLTNDANHMTGPSRDGSGLALAMRKALRSADISEDTVGCIAAHGTGTVYNDAMEMKAFKSVFASGTLPTYSIKGGIGHTMGAAGLVETIVALRSLREKLVPPTVNLRIADDEAEGWVSTEPDSFDNPVTVSINAGFGGVNSALVLKKLDEQQL
ncbi:MAG: beta-ketoacyl synthase N-terminal-like domain-containing protein [bacterium]|nr:beta-ketoacyl synthase N-terminal-like domain-containing protein [bacterium]